MTFQSRPLLDTTNHPCQLLPPSSSSPAPTKRRRQLLATSIKSSPTCTISLENVTVSSSPTASDYIILANSFPFPSSPSTPVSLVPFPSYTETDSELELESAAPKRRRTSRSVCSYTTTTDAGKKRRPSSKPSRRSATPHHTLLSPAARAPLLSSSTSPPRRFANAEVRFVAMVRRTVLNGIRADVDVPMLETGEDCNESIREQNVVLANRLASFLAEKGYQQPPQCVEASSSLPPTPTTSQLVALLILRHNDRSAVRSSKSCAAARSSGICRMPSPLALQAA